MNGKADGTGLYAYAYGGNSKGVHGAAGAGSIGVQGESFGTSGHSTGVYGKTVSTGGIGVAGYAGASSGTTYGVRGTNMSPSGYGVYGYVPVGSGSSVGVYGRSNGFTGYGVYGFGTTGVKGYSPNGPAIYGDVGDDLLGWAGYFSGRVQIDGSLSVTGAKAFMIDHPLDPANKYLYHAAVESSEMTNLYSGVVTLDRQGQAEVALPAWFEAVNGDFRYQLTAIGGAAPNLHIARKITGNRFRIAGGTPALEVSWEVTAVRRDPYARANPLQVEVAKPAAERNSYLYPQGYGKGASASVEARELARADQLQGVPAELPADREPSELPDQLPGR